MNMYMCIDGEIDGWPMVIVPDDSGMLAAPIANDNGNTSGSDGNAGRGNDGGGNGGGGNGGGGNGVGGNGGSSNDGGGNGGGNGVGGDGLLAVYSLACISAGVLIGGILAKNPASSHLMVTKDAGKASVKLAHIGGQALVKALCP